MKNFFTKMFGLGMFLCAISCGQKSTNQNGVNEKTTVTLNAAEFEQAIADKENVVLVDVRTAEEYAEGHLKDAMLIDVKKDNFREECEAKLPRNKKIAVYCRSGFRSKSAAKILNEAGFEVINLTKGYTGWVESGKEVIK